MKNLIIAAAALGLVGCTSMIHSYGELADRQDPCQMKHKPENHVKPEFCKYGSSYRPAVRLYTPQGQLIGIAR